MIKKFHRKRYRVKKKKSILRNRFFWISLFILILIGGLLYLLFFSSFFQIKEIEISGNEKVLTVDLQNTIYSSATRNFLVFSTKSIFLFPSNQIKEELSEKFPQIDQFILKRKLPDSLVLEIQERRATAVFCKETDCFFIDEKGILFEEILEEVPLELIIIKSEIEKSINLGEEIIREENLQRILKIRTKIEKNLKIDIKEVILSFEKLTVLIGEGWEIYFDISGDIEWQLIELSLVLEKQIPLEKRGELEYIDLKFTKVYFKYK